MPTALSEKLTPEEVEARMPVVAHYLGVGLNVKKACAKAGIPRSTYYAQKEKGAGLPTTPPSDQPAGNDEGTTVNPQFSPA